MYLVVLLASPRSLLCFFFSPFPPCSSFPPFSIRCVIFEAQAPRQSPGREWDDDLRSRASFHLLSLYPRARSRSREPRTFPSPLYLAALIFRAGFARVYTSKRTTGARLACLPACLLASLLFRFFAGWMADRLVRSLSFHRLLARACLLWLFVKSKQPSRGNDYSPVFQRVIVAPPPLAAGQTIEIGE